ncbi:hypothetical protein [Marinobacter shengliensis]|uniref:hypothetical protein n=1 Tax=Marinobacter shengliensis TaxID=1389223 RepID=UPI00257438A8|nr:hypothetical protein [Marinobacter shengliensis]BEH14293.1 hypothetical protein MAALD49_16610 [Marinobacter shengliensis]
MAPKTITTELGTERRCTKCGDYWPDDAEFFYTRRGRSHQPCKACYAQLPSRLAKKAGVSGATA